jgi:hypothetical protein
MAHANPLQTGGAGHFPLHLDIARGHSNGLVKSPLSITASISSADNLGGCVAVTGECPILTMNSADLFQHRQSIEFIHDF